MGKAVTKSDKVYGRTIKITHFLNVQLKPRKIPWKKTVIDGYPVYVQISVKRQNTKFRSDLLDWASIEHFEAYKRKKKKELETEISFYRSIIEQAKPFDDENFNLTSALETSSLDDTIDIVIDRCLRAEFIAALREDLINIYRREKDDLFPELKNRNIGPKEQDIIENEAKRKASSFSGIFMTASTAKLFATPQYPVTMALWNRYEIELWLNWDYCTLIERKLGEIPSWGDWLSGAYDDAFMRVFNDREALDRLHSGFEKLKSNHKSLFERYLHQSKK